MRPAARASHLRIAVSRCAAIPFPEFFGVATGDRPCCAVTRSAYVATAAADGYLLIASDDGQAASDGLCSGGRYSAMSALDIALLVLRLADSTLLIASKEKRIPPRVEITSAIWRLYGNYIHTPHPLRTTHSLRDGCADHCRHCGCWKGCWEGCCWKGCWKGCGC